MDTIYRFANKTFLPEQNLLKEDDNTTVLEQRVAELLLVFCQHPGQELSKSELLQRVWPDRVVNEDSLSVAISKLRKALNDNRHQPSFIKTLSGRGYVWLPSVAESSSDPLTPSESYTVKPHKSRYFISAVVTIVALIILSISYTLITDSSTERLAHAKVPEAIDSQHARLNKELRNANKQKIRDIVQATRAIIDQHPEYLPAYLTIAQAKINLSMRNSFTDIELYKSEIESIIDFVLEREPENGRAWLFRGVIAQIADWEYERAGSAYANALKLSPDDPLVYLAYSEYLIARGDFKAAEQFFQQLRQDNPDYYKYLNMSYVYLFKRQYEKALAEVQRISNSEAESRLEQRVLNRVALLTGDEEQAFSTLKVLMKKANMDEQYIASLEQSYLKSGIASVYQSLLNRQVRANLGHHAPPLAWARYAVVAGDNEQALYWLNQAVETRQPAAVFIPLDPHYQPLAPLPAFKQVTQRISQLVAH